MFNKMPTLSGAALCWRTISAARFRSTAGTSSQTGSVRRI